MKFEYNVKYAKGEDYKIPLVISSVLMIAGIIIFLFPYLIQFEELITLGKVKTYWVIQLISAFFIGVGICVWTYYFITVKGKYYTDIMYLKNIDLSTYTFVDKKGNKIKCSPLNTNYTVGKYYEVLRTRKQIKNINKVSTEEFFVPSDRESYWYNWYTPFGNYNDVLLLPIVYIIAAPGIISIFIYKGIISIIGLVYSAGFIFLIIYDLIYKFKRKLKIIEIESSDNNPEESCREINAIDKNDEFLTLQNKSNTIMEMFSYIGLAVICLTIATGGVYLIHRCDGILVSCLISPLVIFSIGGIIYNIGECIILIKSMNPLYIPKNDQMILERIAKKIYIFSFGIFGFGIVFIFCYFFIKDGSLELLLCALLSAVLVAIIFFKTFLKK